jgi:hypothetical protein
MRDLSKFVAALIMTAGLSAAAFAAEGDTERGQTPAAPANTGADNQPNKPPTAMVSPGAKVISKGSKEEEKNAATSDDANNPKPAAPGANDTGNKP